MFPSAGNPILLFESVKERKMTCLAKCNLINSLMLPEWIKEILYNNNDLITNVLCVFSNVGVVFVVIHALNLLLVT